MIRLRSLTEDLVKYFRITSAAREKIDHRLTLNTISNPVVCLMEAGNFGEESPELAKARQDGADDSVLRELALKWLPSDWKQRMRLYPVIYPRRRFLPWNLVKIDGITFFLPFSLRRRVKNGLLDVADEGLKLENADGEVVLPKSL